MVNNFGFVSNIIRQKHVFKTSILTFKKRLRWPPTFFYDPAVILVWRGILQTFKPYAEKHPHTDTCRIESATRRSWWVRWYNHNYSANFAVKYEVIFICMANIKFNYKTNHKHSQSNILIHPVIDSEILSLHQNNEIQRFVSFKIFFDKNQTHNLHVERIA